MDSFRFSFYRPATVYPPRTSYAQRSDTTTKRWRTLIRRANRTGACYRDCVNRSRSQFAWIAPWTRSDAFDDLSASSETPKNNSARWSSLRFTA